MKTFQLRFERSFYIRHTLVLGSIFLMSLVPLLMMKRPGMFAWVMPGTALLLFLLPVREWLIAARVVDGEGVTRQDGKRFLWSDLKELREVNFINRMGQSGGLNHLDIFFTTGRARILPAVLADGYAAILAIREHHGKTATATPTPTPVTPPAPAVPPAPAAPPPEIRPGKPAHCSLCSELGDYHRAMQTHGREHLDTFLPPAIKNLKFIKDLRPGTTRSPELLRCPECGSWFLFKVSYEYLATGSEDEQELSRVTPEQAEEMMKS